MSSGNPDFTSSVKLYGVDADGNPVAVLVDSQGNIQAVLKGEYQGSLQTIATDDKGRLLAIVTDPEDILGNPHHIGNAELAARLGSPVNYDRRGQVIFYDSFEDGLGKWTVEVSGDGGGATVSADAARHGGYSAKLITGSTDLHYVIIKHRHSYWNATRLGSECHFLPSDDITEISLRNYIFDGANELYAWVRYDPINNNLDIRDEYGHWVTIWDNPNVCIAETLFHSLKLVFDISSKTYVRVILNGVEIDISGYPLQARADTRAPHIASYIYCEGTVGINAVCYVDSFIITGKEP